MDTRITTHEAARRLNYSEATIRAAIDSGALRAEKFAGAWAINESWFAEFVETLPIERRALVLMRELVDATGMGYEGCIACGEWNTDMYYVDVAAHDSDCAIGKMIALAIEVNDEKI